MHTESKIQDSPGNAARAVAAMVELERFVQGKFDEANAEWMREDTRRARGRVRHQRLTLRLLKMLRKKLEYLPRQETPIVIGSDS